MESNIKKLEFRDYRPKSEENRKRPASGRLSPRSLFGNLKVKKQLQEEDFVSRNLNNSKNSHGWKPPIKIDSNEVSNKFSSNVCNMEAISHSFPNHETNLSQNNNFIVNEPNFSVSNENLYQAENGDDYHLESGKLYPGNSREIEAYDREFSNPNNLMKDKNTDYSEENICPNLDNYINNSETVLKQESAVIQIDCRQDQQDRNNFQPLVEKLDFPNNNREYLNNNSQESNNLQTLTSSRNDIHFENNQKYGAYDSLSQETVKLERDSHEEYEDEKTPYKEEDQGYSESSDSSKSTIELSDSKKFIMHPNNIEDKNVLPQEINHGNFHENSDKEIKEFFTSSGVDDSFDPGVTNSQFLQLENQISKSSIAMNMKNSYNNRPLINNIENMKRYCTSLVAQSEWQKNILKSITRDIDDLNKAIVNVTGALRSIRKDNPSAK